MTSALVAGAAVAVSSTLLMLCARLSMRSRVVLRLRIPGELNAWVAPTGVDLASWPIVRSHRRRQLIRSLPDGLEAISRSVRSGASLAIAVREAIPAVSPALAQDLQVIADQADLGRPMHECLRAWAQRNPLPDIRLTVAALSFAAQAGGARSRALDGLAESIRDRQALRLEVSALSSQARMSGLVMALLPVGFLAFSLTMDQAASAFLFGTPVGVMCLTVGVTLDVIGFVWMRSMSRVR